MTVEWPFVSGPASDSRTPTADPPFARLGIAGIGLIGGSVALGIRERWPSVSLAVCDRPDRIEEGQRRGIVDAVASTARELASCDVVVLAVPTPAMGGCISELAAAGVRGLVTDVGSTKRPVLQAASRARLPRFVGGHPMSGAERGGLDHARADLFRGRPWLLMEGAASDDAALTEHIVHGLGGVPRWMTADTHDRVMAYVSHLPQLLATMLMNVATDAVGLDGLMAAGPGFTEMTRLASSPSDVWEGILTENADFMDEAVRTFAAALPSGADLRSAEWVRQAFVEAGRSRARWRSKDAR
jgi:prephenate dehydrogenase